MSEQVPWKPRGLLNVDPAIFVANPERRCPCILLLDTSSSMAGEPIRELAGGVRQLIDELKQDELAAKRIELAAVTFGPVRADADFADVWGFVMPKFEAYGDTPMGAAITAALAIVEQRKAIYKANAIPYYKPWIFLITDGAPTDEWQVAAQRVRDGEGAGRFQFFPVGVAGADMAVLARMSLRPPAKLRGLAFREFFKWVSGTLKSVSASRPGDRLALPPPSGWTEVTT